MAKTVSSLSIENFDSKLHGSAASKIALVNLVQEMSETGSAVSTILLQDASNLKNSLSGQNPTAIERLLIERIVRCHLASVRAENSFNNMKALGSKQWESALRWVERTNKMLLHSVEALARVRRLQIPTLVQVNVAQPRVVANDKVQEVELETCPGGRISSLREVAIDGG